MTETPHRDPEEWARLLAAGWERRARSASRDFFVASFEDWDDPQAWERTAREELGLMLTNLDDAWLAAADVLEIGCGSGRLAPFLREKVRSYTGFDIAPGMVEAARERCRDMTATRFLVGDGLGPPAEARDRSYALVLSLAVFVHCPKAVVERNVAAAWELVAPGGELRSQVLGDPADPTGLETGAAAAKDAAGAAPTAPPPAASVSPGDSPTGMTPGGAEDDKDAASRRVEEQVAAIVGARSDEEVELSNEEHYLGHPFGHEETRETMQRCAPGGEVRLYRGHLYAIYGAIRKPAS